MLHQWVQKGMNQMFRVSSREYDERIHEAPERGCVVEALEFMTKINKLIFGLVPNNIQKAMYAF